MSVEKKEVVFMPYKASMWDCFDSVYQAAIQDEEWNVVVMPIPYYNIGKNREILEKHYEGKKFPNYVKIVDYREYDLEIRRPEIIFYHNPYDKYNKVTQIDEKYYSSALKKYCNHLVYIPYDVVCRSIDPYRCLMPGVQNAWRIVVENSKVMEQYIQHGKLSEERVLTLGSPKYDSVLSAIKTAKIPEQWKEKLEGKKIFLYNTHLSEIISAPYVFVKKLSNIVECFEQEQGVALLWRPHPLSMETIKSFRKELLREYMDVIEKVKRAKNAVYDATAELEQSIAIADAYMGAEQSSVSPLFQITEKPMLYTNIEIDKINNTKRSMHSHSNAIVGNQMYMYSCENNVIGVVQSETGEIELLRGCAENAGGTQLVVVCCIVYQENIYFITADEKCIIKFQTNSKELKRIPIEQNYNDYAPILWKQKILFFPCFYSTTIPCIDVKTDEVTYIPTNYEKELNLGMGEKVEYLFYGTQIVDKVLYRGCYIAPIIQKYYLEEQRFEYVTVKGVHCGINNVAYDGEFYWLILKEDSRVLRWDEQKNEIVDVIDLDEYIGIKGSRWVAIQSADRIIYIWQENGTYIVRIDVEQSDIICFDCRDIPEFESPQFAQAFSHAVQYENGKIIFYPYKANGIVAITEEGSISFYKTEIDTKDILRLFPKEQVFSESMCTIPQFVQIVKEGEKEKSHIESDECGSNIWSVVKRELEDNEKGRMI